MTNRNKDHASDIDSSALDRLRSRRKRMLLLSGCALAVTIPSFIVSLCSAGAVFTCAAYAFGIGFSLLALVVVLSYPFGRTPCPRCGKPFFQPEGAMGYVTKVDVLNRACVHCGFDMFADARATETDP